MQMSLAEPSPEGESTPMKNYLRSAKAVSADHLCRTPLRRSAFAIHERADVDILGREDTSPHVHRPDQEVHVVNQPRMCLPQSAVSELGQPSRLELGEGGFGAIVEVGTGSNEQ